MSTPSQAIEAPQRAFTYVPVTHEGQPAYEVMYGERPTGIIRFTRQSANGAAQTLNQNARKLIAARARRKAHNNA